MFFENLIMHPRRYNLKIYKTLAFNELGSATTDVIIFQYWFPAQQVSQ